MFVKVFAAVALAGVALAQTFSIATPPSLQQCQPAALQWTGGTGPFIIAAIPAGQVSAPALATIAEGVNAQTFTWNVNLPQGTAITLRATDAQGNIAYSEARTIQAGGSGCLSASPSGSGAAAPSVSGSAASSVSSVQSAQSSVAVTVSSVSRSVSSSVSTSVSGSSTSSSVSSTVSSVVTSVTSLTPAASASSSRAAADSKASFNIPFLAVAAAIGCVAFGGFATLA